MSAVASCLGLVGTLLVLLHMPDCSFCSPHSCEVVKTRFFTLFWRREPQNGLRDGRPGRFCAEQGSNESDTPAGARPVWKALCGRCGGCQWLTLTVLRGPIRRRPYNRGEIITRSPAETTFLATFLEPVVRRRGSAGCEGALREVRPWRWSAMDGSANVAELR